MDLRDYVRVVRKRWLLIVLLTLAGVAGAATASILSTPRYQASTLVFVAVQSSGQVSELAQANSFTQGQVKSYAEAANQPRVLQPVIDRLRLRESAAALSKDVTADAPLDTVNIEITVTRNSPEEAARIANAVTSSFQQVVSEMTKPANGDPSPVTLTVLRPATVPGAPVSPNTNLNLALGVLVGLALGFGLAILREVLDTRIRTMRDVENITDAPIIGGISFDPNASRRPLIVQADPRSPRAESFRTLRTNLQFLNVEGGPRSFVITSSIESEGKSTTAANLAIALSDAGARVALVDADLRRPKIAEYMGIEGAVGLSDTLIGRVSLLDALQTWGRGNLAVLPAGTTPPNPSELLGSQAMLTLVRTLEKEFDTVLIDVPPLLPVTDGALLSKSARGAIIVVAAGRTQRGELSAALAALENVDARVAGIVMTMLPTKGPDAYGYGRYAYGRYGYGYGTDPAAAASR